MGNKPMKFVPALRAFTGRSSTAPLNKNVRALEANMRFCASSVSGSAAGDYYQLFLGPEETDDSDGDLLEAKGPYLIVQKQFEFPDQGRSYIETHDEHYVGHFRLTLTELSATRLVFELARKTNNQVHISYSLNASEFEEVRRIAEVVFGLREPDPKDDVDVL